MSDSTDTPVVLADKASAAAPVSRPIRAVDMIRLAQGLYFIFFGVLLASVVGAQILILLWLRTLAEVLLGLGVLAVLAGSWRLRQAQLGTGWTRQANNLLVWAALTVYFCVLFYMWRKAPMEPYLQVNAAGFVLCGMCYLITLGQALRRVGEALGRHELAREARWFGHSVVVFLVLPFVTGLVYVSVQAWRMKENPLLQFQDMMGWLSTPVLLVLLLPLSLMLGLLWATKDATLTRLQAMDRN